MPQPASDDGYDSDSGSEFDASDVQLGLADGPLEGDDEANPLVSRIGGRAAWLPMKACPSDKIAQCNSCEQQMQLLVQIFAPLVESPYDRCLLVWGCARPACQRNDASSLRVIRTLKFNCRWAAKLEKQKAKRLAREQAKKEREAAAAKAKQEQEERAKINPFSAPAGGANAGLGGLLFGGSSDNPFATAAAAAPASATHVADEAQDSDDESGDESDEGDEESESERLAEELALKSDLAASAPTAESTWVESSTRYPPLYLNTVPEPCSSSLSKKLSKQEAAMLKSASASGALTTTDSAADDADLKGFAKEGYEKMLLDGIDDTFERFLKRVSVEPRQAVRYEFGGQPIAFHAKGKIYDLLWPKEYQPKAGQGVAVTKGQFTAGSAAPGERSFSARAVPPCQQCGAERVFEAQLMPNLINLLRADQIQAADGSVAPDALEVSLSETQDEEAKRKAAIEQALGRRLPGSAEGNGQKATTGDLTFDARTGLVWSTAFVFVCKNDCCNGELHGDDECWQEEVVLAQFEDEQ